MGSCSNCPKRTGYNKLLFADVRKDSCTDPQCFVQERLTLPASISSSHAALPLTVPLGHLFGPAFLVAPVIQQGATSRTVYLPAGTDWYNYWTNERVHGGEAIQVSAPIDTLPLFVRAGSVLPLGETIESTNQPQGIARLRVYPGADAEFVLYQDDGKTYAYEKGDSRITRLYWNDAKQQLTHQGAAAWVKPDSEIVDVIGRR